MSPEVRPWPRPALSLGAVAPAVMMIRSPLGKTMMKLGSTSPQCQQVPHGQPVLGHHTRWPTRVSSGTTMIPAFQKRVLRL